MDEWFNFASRLGWGLSWWSVLASTTYLLAIISIPSVLLQRRGHPQSAIAWLLILFSLPIVGLFLWWALGRKHLTRKRRRRLRATETVSEALARLRNALPTPPEAASWESLSLRRLPPDEAQWVFPPTSGNHVRLLRDAEQTYPAIEDAIRAATKHLHLLFYIWNDDGTGRRFRDLLVEKAHSGVEVRVLCDAVGSPAARGKLMRPLVEAGGKVGIFLPPHVFSRNPHWNFRNHRKLVIADGCRGIVGGLNIGDEYTHNWHDTALEMRGPVVDQLQEVFADDWYFTTGENLSTTRYFGCHLADQNESSSWGIDDDALCGVIASGPHTRHNLTHDTLFIAITQATHRVWITSPYLIPNPSIRAALRTAVYRGVDVRVLLPESGDTRLALWASRSYYPELLGAGVRIHEYLPYYMHAKTAVFDDDLSVVGSANIDIRSFRLNFEVSCSVRSAAFSNELATLFERDLQKSHELSYKELEKRSVSVKLIESAAQLFSPLL